MLLFIIILIGAFLRFYNLLWGDGNFFHPDENNMAHSISQMSQQNSLHPNFFAYGQLPLYFAYFLAQVIYAVTSLFNPTSTGHFPFFPVLYKDGVFGLRVLAALTSTLTIPLVYLLIKEFFNTTDHKNTKALWYALIGSSLVAFLPGLIQSAHFGTTESLLTFFFVGITYLSVRLLRIKKYIFWHSLAIGILIGLALGTKITAAFFLVPPFLAILLQSNHHSSLFRTILGKIMMILFILCTASLFFSLSSPYSVLDWTHFYSTSRYESEVATGAIPVFYTRQFTGTTPTVFQLTHIFPYVLGVGLLVTSIVSFFILPVLISKDPNKLLWKQWVVMTVSFLFLLIGNSFLYVKWTRFVTPLLPFFAVYTAVTFYLLEIRVKHTAVIQRFLVGLLVLTSANGLYFFSIYVRPDIRTSASQWIYESIPQKSYVLSETGNVVDIPLEMKGPGKDELKNTGTYGYQVISFDFYHLDQDKLQDNLINHLVEADYIFMPSRRIFYNYTRFPEKFPILNAYYAGLLNGKLGFTKVSEFNSFPFLSDEPAEETWTVFDHPVVRIYKRI